MARIRLISDIAPGSTHTAGIVLEQIIRHLGSNYDWEVNVLVDDGLPEYPISSLLQSSSVTWTRKPQEWHPKNILFKYLIAPIVEKFSEREIDDFVKEIIRRESRNISEIILIAIQGQSSYRVARELLRLKLPVSLIFWDPWEWWQCAKNVPHGFNKTIEEVHKLAAKQGMHLFPTREFGISLGFRDENIVVLYPHTGEFNGQAKVELGPDENLKVLFLGQAYASKEIQIFVDFVEAHNDCLFDKKVKFFTYGRNAISNIANATHLGWADYESLSKSISQFDMGLLPYPSDLWMQSVAKLSFPSKLAQYITAGLDIAYIGPYDSSVLNFFCSNEVKFDIKLLAHGDQNTQDIYIAFINFNSLQQVKNMHEKYFSHGAIRSVLNIWLKAYGVEDSYSPESIMERTQENITIRSVSRINHNNYISTNIYKRLLLPLRITRKTINFMKKFYHSLGKLINVVGYILLVFRSFKRLKSALMLVYMKCKNRILP